MGLNKGRQYAVVNGASASKAAQVRCWLHANRGIVNAAVQAGASTAARTLARAFLNKGEPVENEIEVTARVIRVWLREAAFASNSGERDSRAAGRSLIRPHRATRVSGAGGVHPAPAPIAAQQPEPRRESRSDSPSIKPGERGVFRDHMDAKRHGMLELDAEPD